MQHYKKHHRLIATFFLLIIFPTFFPTNGFSSTGGPKSPEAASFEPIDATDMVNLITGQYSYVLPLLNVPSPEGGYPIALGYHAGIAMDQEASWAGLGWNVNPGAIDRNVSGYPDDYKSSSLNEYFYDEGDSGYTSYISVGYSNGATSAGIGINWGSHQSLGGYVSVGLGFDIGYGNSLGLNASLGISNGKGYASAGASFKSASGLTFGVNASTNGSIGGSVGIATQGFSNELSFDNSGTVTSSSKVFALGYSMSSGNGGNHSQVSVGGVGLSTSFNNSYSKNDYTFVETSNNNYIPIPTPAGLFSLSFGKQTFKYWAAQNKDNFITGPLYMQNGVKDLTRQVWLDRYRAIHTTEMQCGRKLLSQGGSGGSGGSGDPCNGCPPGGGGYNGSGPLYTHCGLPGSHPGYPRYHQIQTYCNSPNGNDGHSGPHSYEAHWITVPVAPSFMDINEISIDQNSLSSSTNITSNSMSFPNYDNFNVQAQGLSGNMSAPMYKSGALIGLSNNENNLGYSLKYNINGSSAVPDFAKFEGKPYFYLENEISTYINVQPSTFNTNQNNSNILNYYNSGSIDLSFKPRRKTSTFIEYFTNDEIKNNLVLLKEQGFLETNSSGFERNKMPLNGIGAFKITAIDGKTYHYSLPVYNHEIITRSFGMITERQEENKSYIEKRQLEPFATHWLLTAVTGSDFIDNGDGIAGDGDLGYWTNFEYGKWSDAFVWKAPHDKDYIVDNENSNIKTWIKGRKQMYYLDKIKTRTHSAIFIKSQRNDSQSPTWNYSSVNHININSGPYVYNRHVIPSQKQLRLDKIILLKNEDALSFDKTSGLDNNQEVTVGYVGSPKTNDVAKFNCLDNIFDINDILDNNIISNKVIKIIDFKYGDLLSLSDSRLSLESVQFNGKGGAAILPPYKFKYMKDQNLFNPNLKDSWGYNQNNPAFSSLNEIKTPYGGSINIGYEKNKYINVSSTVSPNNVSNYGAGCRVSFLKIYDGLSTYFTDYKYGQDKDGIGYVSYIPEIENLTKEISYSSELPSPRVMYENVSMSTNKLGFSSNGEIQYKFNIMKTKDPNNIKYGDFYEIIKTGSSHINSVANKSVNVSSFTVKDNLASIGQLLEVKVINENGQLLNKTVNEYYNTIEQTPNLVGMQQESYQSYKTVDYNDNSYTDKWLVNSSTRISYPNLIKLSKVQSNSFVYTTQSNDYDLISGISKEQVFTSSDGKSFKTKTVPAYFKYPEMGSKVDDINNKNMLSQTAASYSYILDKPTNTWKETGVGISTWSNIWTYKDIGGDSSTPTASKEKIWRKHKSYIWNGPKDTDGIYSGYNSTNDDGFVWGVGLPQTNIKWKQASEVTLYDHFSAALTMKDINGNFASTKMGDNETKVTATGNAGYNEMFFTSAETIMHNYYLDPEVRMVSATRDLSFAHTGKYSVATTSASQLGVFMRSGQHRAGKYKLSVWVKRDNESKARVCSFNNTTSEPFNGETYYAGNWAQKTHYFTATTADFYPYVNSVDGTTVYYDDLMIRPVASSITGYVYNSYDELTYIVGNNGLATKFEYDDAGRLVKTYIEVVDDIANSLTGGFKLSSENKIKFRNL